MVDIFSAAAAKIGAALSGGPGMDDPLFQQAMEILDAEPEITDADLAAELGVKMGAVKKYRKAVKRWLEQEQKKQEQEEQKRRRRQIRVVPPRQSGPTTQSLPAREDGSVEGQATTIWQSSGQHTATMTAEELAARRYARIERAPVGRSWHDKALLKLKALWRLIGPLWFVVVTAGEVVSYLSHYMPQADLMTQALIWGVALFMEISMMIATYDLSNRNRVEAEKRGAGVEIAEVERRRRQMAVFFWILLAAANVTGQVAFLWFVTHPAALPGGAAVQVDTPTQVWLIIFIVVRVAGMLVGDANTAFVLGDDEEELAQVARNEKQRGDAFLMLARVEGEVRRNVAKANQEIAEVDVEIERMKMRLEEERRRARYHADLDKIMMEESLERQRQRLLPPPQTGGSLHLVPAPSPPGTGPALAPQKPSEGQGGQSKPEKPERDAGQGQPGSLGEVP